MAPLLEKLDIYLADNILYGITTCNRPWNYERGKHIKAAIKKGYRPPIDGSLQNAEETVNAELTNLFDDDNIVVEAVEAETATAESSKEGEAKPTASFSVSILTSPPKQMFLTSCLTRVTIVLL